MRVVVFAATLTVMTSRLAKQHLRSVPKEDSDQAAKPVSGFYTKKDTGEEDRKMNVMSDEKRRREVLLKGGQQEPTHYKVCNKCNQRKDVASFEGYKRCKECREKNNKAWHRIMVGYQKAGLKQRIALSDDEREKILSVFSHSCAFCGNSEETKLRFTRLIAPRNGGGDEMFNIIPCCTSCMQSRKGWATWEDWYISQPEMYSKNRYSVIMAHHNELPIPKKKPVNNR